MLTVAIVAALASALCFGVAAALQQREAGLAVSSGVADPRLLVRLAHRPIWLTGVCADGLSAALHVLALSQGSIAVVQPLGVTGLLFAIPLVAVLRRQPVPLRDILAAMVVLAGLGVLLQLVPHTTQAAEMGPRVMIIAVPIVALVFAAAMLGLAHARPGRPRALLLAVAAGTSFGIVAVLVRALLQMMGQPHQGLGIAAAAVGIALLVPSGYLLLQQAYRVGYFAATLATAVVVDPLAALLGGVLVLNEPLTHTPGQAIAAVISAAAIIAGIAVLATSPAHVFTIAAPQPQVHEGTD